MTHPTESDIDGVQAWVDYESRLVRQADMAAVGVVLAVLIGALLALAVLHWATPCEGASLCTLLALPRRAATRLWLAARACYLRALLASAEADAQHHEGMARLEPELAALARLRAAELRIQIIDCELGSRDS